MKKYHIIYKTTNLVNGKYYIGKHSTNDLNDGYLGSGIVLRRAIKLHGIENFSREILFVFDNENEMNSKEKELITEESINSTYTYNIALGGQGGNLGNLVNQKIGDSMKRVLTGVPKTEEHKKAMSACRIGYKPTSEVIERTRKTMLKFWSEMSPEERKQKCAHYGEKNGFYGKSHTEESKNKTRNSIGDSRKGSKNPRAKSITIYGVTYATQKECMEALGINKYRFYKLIGDNKC